MFISVDKVMFFIFFLYIVLVKEVGLKILLNVNEVGWVWCFWGWDLYMIVLLLMYFYVIWFFVCCFFLFSGFNCMVMMIFFFLDWGFLGVDVGVFFILEVGVVGVLMVIVMFYICLFFFYSWI